jgi:hypothetical protein
MILPGSANSQVPPEMRDEIFRAQITQALSAIGGQLDLLIQLECGYLPRKKMKDWFIEVNKASGIGDKATLAEAEGQPHAEGGNVTADLVEANLLDDEMRAKIEAAAQEFEGADLMEEQMALD